VLVVDDSPQIRELIKVNLELEGFTVATAADGLLAVGMVAMLRPDVLTIDVRLPGIDGVEAVTRLRADPATADVGVAMVTACAQESDRARAAQAGVDVFLTKPFDPAVLVAEVARLVAGRQGDGLGRQAGTLGR